MLKYIFIALLIVSSCKSRNIILNHDKHTITINGEVYKSSIIELDTEYFVQKNELILSNQYNQSRDKSVQYYIFDLSSLYLNKYIEISCDNLTQICTGGIDIFIRNIHLKNTINENFLDSVNDCNIELISTYPNDSISLKKIDTYNYRKVTYKINHKSHNFIYYTLLKPHRMYLTKKYSLYIPLCNTMNQHTSILECSIKDGNYFEYKNLNCIKNEQ